MDYKLKYEKALERAKGIINYYKERNRDEAAIEDIQEIFTELKEDDDERIRKAILNYFTKCWGNCKDDVCGVHVEDAIAWLEKQGKTFTQKDVDDAYLQGISNTKNELEKQGEQKPADKVEPKFQNGEWIVWQDKCYKVNYNGCGYELVDKNGLSTSLEYGTVDGNAQLWDITKDARDGDLIYVSTEEKGIQAIFHEYKNGIIFFHCYLCYDFAQGGYMPIGSVELVYPLQKTHYNRFFEKMHEAGYKWNVEKKELKKIKQKPAWSEEDKNFMYDTLSNLTELKDRYGEGYGNVGKCIDWLKSIKQKIGGVKL